jgi:hypothetical protein
MTRMRLAAPHRCAKPAAQSNKAALRQSWQRLLLRFSVSTGRSRPPVAGMIPMPLTILTHLAKRHPRPPDKHPRP